MKYEVTFSCGHTETVDLIGRVKDRESKIKYFEEKGLCSECYKKAKEEQKRKEREEADAKAKDLGFPELEGSEKQVAWANDIRIQLADDANKFLTRCRRNLKRANDPEKLQEAMDLVELYLAELGAETSAHEIIENRRYVGVLSDVSISALNEIHAKRATPETYECRGELLPRALKKMFGAGDEGAAETTILEPTEKESSSLAKVSYHESRVDVSSPKDNKIIHIAKGQGYKWNGGTWSLQINFMTGTAEDRAAEIANLMLNAGISVEVPVGIADKAVSGNFTPRCSRWIFYRRDEDTDAVFLRWDKSDDLYGEAKKISGATWRSGIGMKVPTSSADELEDFAEMYGFQFSEGAQKAIARYREKVMVVAPEAVPEEKQADPEEKLEEILNSSRDVIEDLKDEK